MLQKVVYTILRTIFAYILLLIVTRTIGRKAISQMTFFDFAVAITLGSVTANLALGPQTTVVSATTTLVLLGTLAVIVDYSHIKSFLLRKAEESEPVVIIKNGKIEDKNMEKIRLNMNDLLMQLRQNKIFNIADVEFAVMENNGRLSVLPKSQKQPMTPSDLNIPTPYKGLTKDLIIDGNILYENLRDVKLNKQWLQSQLKSKGINNVKSVLYAGLDTSGNLYVSRKSDDTEEHGKYGIE